MLKVESMGLEGWMNFQTASGSDYYVAIQNGQCRLYNFTPYVASSQGGGDYSLFFNGETLSVMQGDNTIYSTAATSGKGEHMNNPNSQKISNLGPIPEGNYFFYNHKWSEQTKIRQVYNIIARNGDWVDWNVPLNYISWKGPRTLRHSFYLHGGFWPGSAGCIDAGGNVGDIYNYVKNQGVTYLRVQY
ncbi:tlde1 domain-containing protein [Mangrovibacterium sp.]|uniref:tlde1 domain-containing protein n=1 Tax=Mangrovibacterium sp. TaxID=1961364 RepID=UPI0035667BDB